MHLPDHNVERSAVVLQQFIRDNPLGIFTTAIRSPTHPLIQSSHIPWLVDVDDESDETQWGKLRGHIARQNPQAQAIIEALTTAPGEGDGKRNEILEEEVMILFNGPAHHYVTPKFYVKTKPETGKVAPTWNYEAVQVYGTARVYHDTEKPEFDQFLSRALMDLAQHTETSIMGYGKDGEGPPWQVSDAPVQYINLLKKKIIGIEIEIKSMAGRFKMSQEKAKGDQEGVINGLKDLGTPAGTEIAGIMRERIESYEAKKVVAKSVG